jgi:phospholipid/cholesterol/gamma-HCH transport system permease protein
MNLDSTLRPIYHLGRFIQLLGNLFRRPENMRMYMKEFWRQAYEIGIGSLPIVCLISVFIGAVAAIQFAYQLSGQFIPRYYVGYIVRDLAIIELSPTFTCLVLAGKVGSNMASELGGMRQKEHIDAMEIMGVNTATYLIMPKLFAAAIMIPVLVTFSAYVAIAGGYLAVVPQDTITDDEYMRGLRSFFLPANVNMMYVKAFVFAIILTTVSCYQGYYCTGGSIELGKASTRAVVFSDVFILIADYVLALLLTS